MKKELKKIGTHEIEVYKSIKITTNEKSKPKKVVLKKPIINKFIKKSIINERKRPAKTIKPKTIKRQKIKETQIQIKTEEKKDAKTLKQSQKV